MKVKRISEWRREWEEKQYILVQSHLVLRGTPGLEQQPEGHNWRANPRPGGQGTGSSSISGPQVLLSANAAH